LRVLAIVGDHRRVAQPAIQLGESVFYTFELIEHVFGQTNPLHGPLGRPPRL
jgi:hypothetical protein